MSKIAKYLNEHLAGEVVSSGQDVVNASVDGSQLLQQPEMIAHVASTNDIRKIARFCWQLAEKGHSLSVTVRGRGTDTTGAATGPGIIISPEKYMTQVVGIDPKQRLIHVQSGAPYAGVNMTLSTHRGMTLPSESVYGDTGTIGGAIATGAAGYMTARYGTVGKSVRQLEVVLANGDVLQTGRLTKRELNTKKGLHTMEGEVYREIDNLITDNLELIKSLAKGPTHDLSGYRSIIDVKQKDGSIDLTPLFIGSQGTLGVIAEVIMQSQFKRHDVSVMCAAYESFSDAHAAADTAVASKAAAVELIDGRLIKRAATLGKTRDFAPEQAHKGALLVVVFDAYAERTRRAAAKKLQRELTKLDNTAHISLREGAILAELSDIHGLITVASQSGAEGRIVPGVFRGVWLPAVQLDSFLGELRKLEVEYTTPMPIFVDQASGFVDLLPEFDMKKVSDRQKLLKILAALTELVEKHGGSMAGHGGDGRIKSALSQSVVPEDVAELYAKIKQIFDPHNILNPGVKQKTSPKELASQINAWCRANT